MAATTKVNGQTVVHKTSEGVLNTFPDVCLTPIGSSVVPVPYANTALSKDTSMGSKSVTVDGNPVMLKDSVFSKSTGDEPGSRHGVASGATGGPARFTNYSFDVKIEGRNVCRRLDPMISNKGNTPPAPLMQPNIGGEELTGKHTLPITFVFEHPNVGNGQTEQPCFSTFHTARGPETHRQEFENYTGNQHKCESEGLYSTTFDAFDIEKEPFE